MKKCTFVVCRKYNRDILKILHQGNLWDKFLVILLFVSHFGTLKFVDS